MHPTPHPFPSTSMVPAELQALRAKIRALPDEGPGRTRAPGRGRLRAGPVRGRALSLAREALEQFRLELSAAKFDLDITRREREGLRRLAERDA